MHSTVLACPCCGDRRLYPTPPHAVPWSLAGRRCLASCASCAGRCLGRYAPHIGGGPLLLAQ